MAVRLVALGAVAHLLQWLHCASADGNENPCTLVSLTLRYGDWPIDLDTPFEPDITQYTATLDFSMSSFSINVRPDTGCEVDSVPNEPTPVRIGDTTEVTIYAKQPASGAKQGYTVTVSRLLGSETELKSLEIQGGVMRPMFDPKIRDYQVHLELGYDEIRAVYRLYDNEQRIRTSAQTQHPTGEEAADATTAAPSEGGNATNSSGGGADGDSGESDRRRLQAVIAAAGPPRRLIEEVRSGESQLREASASFMLDVGFSRTLELIVQCADATQASIGRYRLEVARQGCGPKRPYFDPQKKFCVFFCSAGFYRNSETHRCSHCNTNCKQCTGLLECSMCVPDTTDYTYAIQPDGKCRATANHLFKRYRWWCIGLGVLLVFLVLFGCVGICQLCCSAGRGRGSHHKLPTYDSDSDDAPAYAPGGRLAMY